MKKLTLLLILILVTPFCGGPKKGEPAAAVDTTRPAVTSESTPAIPASPPAAEVQPRPAPPAAQNVSEKPATPPPPASSEAPPEKPAALPKLWDFFATWCPPCQKQAPIIEELAREYEGRIEIVSIDTDKNPELAHKFNVRAIPTLIFLDAQGRELSRNVGFMSKAEILARFRQHKFIE